MRLIDAVPIEGGWALAWIVDDVLWGRWSDDEYAWVQVLPHDSESTTWRTCDAAESYLNVHRPTMEHAHFAVSRKLRDITTIKSAECLENRSGLSRISADTGLQACLS